MGTRGRLAKAQRDTTMVRVVRSPKHADKIEGFIVAVGDRWAVIQGTHEGGYFDGYSAFRLEDVTKIRPARGFSDQFARTLPTWPPRCPEGLELDSTVSVLHSMAARSTVIGIEQENRLSAIWIGKLVEAKRRWTWLLEIRPDATWHEEPLGYKTKKITLVTIDSLYQRALLVVAGDTPA